MAWTEQCKVAFEFGVRAKLKQGLNKAKALRELSEESEIPYNTLKFWHYEKSKSMSSHTTPATNGNNTETTTNVEPVVCIECGINPVKHWRNQCGSCKAKISKRNKRRWLHQVSGHIRSLKKQLEKENSLLNKWKDGITRIEYEEVIKDISALLEIWKELSNGAKIKS